MKSSVGAKDMQKDVYVWSEHWAETIRISRPRAVEDLPNFFIALECVMFLFLV